MNELKTDALKELINLEASRHEEQDQLSYTAMEQLAALKERIAELDAKVVLEATIGAQYYQECKKHAERIYELEQQLRDAERKGYELAQKNMCYVNGEPVGYIYAERYTYAEARAAQNRRKNSMITTGKTIPIKR